MNSIAEVPEVACFVFTRTWRPGEGHSERIKGYPLADSGRFRKTGWNKVMASSYAKQFAILLAPVFAFGIFLAEAVLAETRWVPVTPGYSDPPNWNQGRNAHGQSLPAPTSGLPSQDSYNNTRLVRYTTTYTLQDAQRVQSDLRRSGHRTGEIVPRRIVKQDRFGKERAVDLYDVYVYQRFFR